MPTHVRICYINPISFINPWNKIIVQCYLSYWDSQEFYQISNSAFKVYDSLKKFFCGYIVGIYKHMILKKRNNRVDIRNNLCSQFVNGRNGNGLLVVSLLVSRNRWTKILHFYNENYTFYNSLLDYLKRQFLSLFIIFTKLSYSISKEYIKKYKNILSHAKIASIIFSICFYYSTDETLSVCQFFTHLCFED